MLVQGTADVDDRDLAANRERYWRESGEKLPATQGHAPAEARPRVVRLVLHADLRPRAPRARLRVGRRGPDERARAARRPHGGGALRPQRGAARAARAGGGRRRRLGTSGSRSSAAGTRLPSSRWVGPDGFPLAVRVPVSLDRGSRRIVFGAVPAELPLIARAVPASPRTHTARLHLAGELPGPRRSGPGRRRLGRWSRTSSSAASSSRTRAQLARYRRNLSKSIRFYKTARRYRKSEGV